MDSEFVEVIVDHFSKKYKDTSITFTGNSFIVNGPSKDYIILEMHTIINALENSKGIN